MTGLNAILAHARSTGSAQFTWAGSLNWLAQNEEGGSEWYVVEDGGDFVSQPFATAEAAVAWLRTYEQGGDIFALEGVGLDRRPLQIPESV